MDKEAELEARFYLFRLHLRKAANAANRLMKKGGKFSLKVSYKQGQGVTSSFEMPDAKGSTEFAVLMSRFLLPRSPLYLENILDMLSELSTSDELRAFTVKAKASFARAKEGRVTIERKGRRMRSEEMFTEIAQNVYFCGDLVRLEYERELETNPLLKNLYWHTFFEYCLDAFQLLSATNRFIEEKGFYPKHVKREGHCVYCASKNGRFLEVEHIIPEALGNDDLILPRGYVCGACNNRLSSLENDFVNSLPFSLLRIFCTSYGKKGILPSHSYPGAKVEKTSPNSIRYLAQRKDESDFNLVPNADGTYSFTMSVRDHRPFDKITTARAMFKIAIGALAAEEGREAVLDPRFDPARAFIQNGGSFRNRLVMAVSVKPRTSCSVSWGRGVHGGVIVELNLLGAVFIVGLEPDLLVALPEDLLRGTVVWDLWNDSSGPHHGAWTSVR